jgi:hypothetical protein
MVFKDYSVVKGSAVSELYSILRSKGLKNKFRHDYYWFREEDLKARFAPKEIPYMLDLKAMDEEQHKKRSYVRKHTVVQNMRKACILHYDTEGHVIFKYKNTAHAAYMLKTSMSIIQKLCRGLKQNDYYILKYGEKSLQPVGETYPEYTIEELRRPPRKVLEVSRPRPTKFWR